MRGVGSACKSSKKSKGGRVEEEGEDSEFFAAGPGECVQLTVDYGAVHLVTTQFVQAFYHMKKVLDFLILLPNDIFLS